MNSQHIWSAAAVFLLLVPAVASAQPPSRVPIQAYLTDSEGVPVDGEVSASVEIFGAETGGTTIYSESFSNATADAGSLTLRLGSTQSLDLSIFRDNTDLWAEITVDGETLQPRLRIETAPYAATAGDAETAQNAEQLAGQDPSAYQTSAGTGLVENSGTLNLDVQNSCPSGEVAIGLNNDGTLNCQAATSFITTGTGITENNGTLNLDIQNSCGMGEFAVGIQNDGTLNCQQAASLITAGTGLMKSGNTIGVASGGITATQVASNTLSQGEINSGAIGTSELQNNAVTSSEITDGEVKSADLASGAVTGSEIASGAVGSGQIASGAVGSGKIASGAVGSGEIASGAVGSGEIASGAVGSGKIASGAVGSTEIATNSVGTDELKSGAVTTNEIQDDTIDRNDIGTYGCDSNTNFVEVNNCSAFGSAADLPNCDEVGVGGVCEADAPVICALPPCPPAPCSNAPDNGHCSGSSNEFYIRTSW